MSILNCPTCGGDHFNRDTCPFTGESEGRDPARIPNEVIGAVATFLENLYDELPDASHRIALELMSDALGNSYKLHSKRVRK